MTVALVPLMTPTVALPEAIPSTAQVTAVLLAPETVAVRRSDFPVPRVVLAGVTSTCTPPARGAVAEPGVVEAPPQPLAARVRARQAEARAALLRAGEQ